MKVLSLFDGMSCGQIALDKLGVDVETYYASEIDKYGIEVTQANYSDTIQLGDVTKWKEWDIDWENINLLFAGSPCQGFSFAGNQLAFDDPRSSLFFTFVEIWEHIKSKNPNAKYLLENVRMKKEHEAVISRIMEISPIIINSALLSAQNRLRLYWTNIASEKYGLFGDLRCSIRQPDDKGILLSDVLEDGVDQKYYLSEKVTNRFKIDIKENGVVGTTAPSFRTIGQRDLVYGTDNKMGCLMVSDYKQPKQICVAMGGRNPDNPKSRKAGLPTKQMIEPREDDKTNCLTTVQKNNLVYQLNTSTESGGQQPYQQNRVYADYGKSPCLDTESGRKNVLQLKIPENTKKGFVEIKPGECFDSENMKSKTRRGRKMKKKSNCLMAKTTDFLRYELQGSIRRLTPTECERLQTVPDGYTDHVSDTQRYKMLGNGWTVDVIVYILQHLDLEK